MSLVTILDSSGSPAAQAAVADEVSSQQIKPHLIHETVVAELAAQRSGTHSTLTRGQARGGGRKPWRQKGTGRARQGSIRAPHWTGGGVAFGPTPRSYGGKVNRKIRRQALLGAVRAHVERASVAVMDPTGWDRPSTKRSAAYLGAAPEGLADRPLLVVLVDPDGVEGLSFRNIEGVEIIAARDLRTVDVMSFRSLLVERGAWEDLWGDLGDATPVKAADFRTAADALAERQEARRAARADKIEAKRAVALERAERRAAELEAAERQAAERAPVAEEPEEPAADEDEEATELAEAAEPEAAAEADEPEVDDEPEAEVDDEDQDEADEDEAETEAEDDEHEAEDGSDDDETAEDES